MVLRNIAELDLEIKKSREKGTELFKEVEKKNSDGSNVHDADALQKHIDNIKENGLHLDKLIAERNTIITNDAERIELLAKERERLNQALPNSPRIEPRDPDGGTKLLNWGTQFFTNAVKNNHGLAERSGVIDVEGMAEELFNEGGRYLNTQPVATADFETARPFRGIVGMAVQPPLFMDLFRIVPVDKLKFDWLLQTLRTITATGVKEGVAATASDFVWTTQNVSLKRIRHITVVTDDILDSEMLLNALIHGEMADGVRETISTQLLRGAGTLDIKGIAAYDTLNATTRAFASYTGEHIIDKAEEMFRLVMTVGRANPEAFAVHPTIWSMVKRMKATTGEYLYQHPSQSGPKSLWGYPVVETTEFVTPAKGTVGAVTGAFQRYAPVFRKGAISVETTDANGTDFEKWQTTMRAGTYVDMVLQRAKAFAGLTFT